MSYKITPPKHTTNRMTIGDKIWFALGIMSVMVTMVAFWIIVIFMYLVHTTGLTFY